MKVKLLNENAIVPARATKGAAGLDLFAIENVIIKPMERASIGTGVAVAIPEGSAGMIWPRSGLAARHGIDVLGGLIDSDYRGEVKVMLINFSAHDVTIYAGDRIAQIVCQPINTANAIVVDDLDVTVRGINGFGSTGV